ncbi:MAG: MFS transporter [Acidobacteria bacterium]|nr:MFS transporter [Acidobacteriota bacterium]
MSKLPRSPHRRRVLLFAMTLAIITYVDRVAIAQAQPLISHDLKLDKLQMGVVFAAFGWAYALFEMPSGFLGDWLGCRRVLLRIVLWWSFFTAATGWAWSFPSLVVTRFLFGMGEAGAFPNLIKAFSVWLAPGERTRAQGLLWLSARWGGALTPYLVVLVLKHMDWRHAFLLFGTLGVMWAVLFAVYSRTLPEPAPLSAGHERVPWGLLLRSRQVWLLLIPYFTSSYGWWFYITWLPSYLRESRHLALDRSALLAGLPLFVGGLGSLCSGFLTSPLTRFTGSVGATRRLMAYVGYTGAAVMLVAAAKLSDPLHAMLAMALASFANDLVMPGAWGACMDVGGRYAGTLSGAMGGFGNAGGAISPLVVGFILQSTNNNWDLAIYISAAVYFAGAFCWAFLDPVTPLVEQLPRNSNPPQGSR